VKPAATAAAAAKKSNSRDEDSAKKAAAAENTMNNAPNDISSPSELTVAPYAGKRLEHTYLHAPMDQIWLNPSLCFSKSLKETTDHTRGETLIGRHWVSDEGYFIDAKFSTLVTSKLPLPSGCTCGANHNITTPNLKKKSSSVSDTTNGGRTRRSERSGASARMASVINQLASNTLSPHTLISCEEYTQ
jgi:hypothetical protein